MLDVELVDRVAQAIAAHGNVSWDWARPNQRAQYRRMAQAATAELLEIAAELGRAILISKVDA